ncbi:MAG: HD-GYP domain-containing protein [Bacteriovoracaceae bacterium]
MKSDFTSIRINTLRAGTLVPFDLYVLVGDHHVHYTQADDDLEENRVKNLKQHGVKKVFIKPLDEPKYLTYLEAGLDTLSNKNIQMNERAALANDTMVTSVENAEKNLETESGYLGQKKQLDLISSFIGSDRNSIKEMLSSAGISLDNNQHSATVSSLCLAVATKLEKLTKEEITELGFAALLHDIGKNRLKFDLSIPVSKLTPQQLKQYKNHPEDGVAMLSGKPFISPRILGLIASHEEYGLGRGFPEKKDISKLDISYQILSLVNKFDHFCQEKGLAAISAIDPFFDQYANDYDEELFSVLATVLT